MVKSIISIRVKDETYKTVINTDFYIFVYYIGCSCPSFF